MDLDQRAERDVFANIEALKLSDSEEVESNEQEREMHLEFVQYM